VHHNSRSIEARPQADPRRAVPSNRSYPVTAGGRRTARSRRNRGCLRSDRREYGSADNDRADSS
jgi:hypothetical protein